jgi:CrcB protein
MAPDRASSRGRGLFCGRRALELKGNMEMLVRVALVGLGGALGAVARYLLGLWIATHASPDFPWSTFLVNISGSFLIGVFLGLASAGQLSNEARLFLAVGVLGGYTTFSTFSYETVALMEDGQWPRAALYVALSVGLSVLGTFLGIAAARELVLVRLR